MPFFSYLRLVISAFLTVNLGLGGAVAQFETLPDSMLSLERRWAEVKYQMTDKASRLEAVHDLKREAASAAQRYENQAAPYVWLAVALMLEAELHSNISSLGMVKEARKLLTKAEAIDTEALNGLIHTSLGQLYDRVPGWPIGFGSDSKAEEHFKKALEIDPNGIDTNFRYGHYLLRQYRTGEAETYLRKALQAPVRDEHAALDRGRKAEARAALEQISKAR